MRPRKAFSTPDWDAIASQPAPSWYLDPLVAAQKQRLHLDLLRRWAPPAPARRLLKTDLFEEAYGDDRLLDELSPAAVRIGMDLSQRTARAALSRLGPGPVCAVTADVRGLPFPSDSMGLIFSNSTLDHFETEAEFCAALAELARVLQPGGRLIVTMDNPANPTYWLLRWTSRLPAAPFPIGYTTTAKGLSRALRDAGLEVVSTGTLIHNPRLISTLLFLAVRRLLGARADGVVRAMLRLFATLERLPTRRLTACFVAACAVKPAPKSSPAAGADVIR
jgi:SAM-dependent methyltransferase